MGVMGNSVIEGAAAVVMVLGGSDEAHGRGGAQDRRQSLMGAAALGFELVGLVVREELTAEFE